MTVLDVPMFKGSMTRSLLRCFPGGRANDKKPVPNELSVLIFYLQTRPQKIPKAASMLAEKSHKFARKNNLGNLQVCALIMHEIVNSLSQHINLFAKDGLEVIEILLDKSEGVDMSLYTECVNLFRDYNKVHDGVLFSGFPGFTQHFMNVVSKFVQYAEKGNLVTRTYSVSALNSLGSSPAIENRQGKQAISIALKGILYNISDFNDDLISQSSKEFKIKDTSERELNLVCYSGLHTFLTTQSLSQISRILQTVLAWLVTRPTEWSDKLLLRLAEWIAPQNRFVVAITAVSLMAQLQLTSDMKQQIIYTHFLNTLLSADDSKFGLSVVDVLRRLITLQHRVLKEQKHNPDSNLLVSKLRENIYVLTNTQIYPGQSGDMVNEILVRYSTCKSKSSLPNSVPSTPRHDHDPTGSPNTTTTSARTPMTRTNSMYTMTTFGQSLATSQDFNEDCLSNDFLNIQTVLDAPATEGQKLPLASWEGTHWILELKQRPEILRLYVSTFQKYLKEGHQGEHVSTKRGSLLSRNFCTVMLQPDLLPGNYAAVHYCLQTICKALQTESIFLMSWVYPLIETQNNELRMSSALTIFSEIFEICERLRAKEFIDSEIQHYREAGLFYEYPENLDIDSLPEITNTVWNLQLDKCPLSEPDQRMMFDPPFHLSSEFDDDLKPLRQPLIRARTLSGRSATSLHEMSPPRAKDLVKRQTDTLSFRSGRSSAVSSAAKLPLPSMRTENSAVDQQSLKSILSNVELDTSNRGRLTV